MFQRKGAAAVDYERLLRRIVLIAESVEPLGEPPACRDEDDRKFLHAALFADADYLVTFDEDLLAIGTVGRTPILRPAEAVERLRADGAEI